MSDFLLNIDGYVQANSVTSNTIAGSGAKTFTLVTEQPFENGMVVTADAGSGNTMTGTVTGYRSLSTTLTLTITGSTGSGTHSAWVIGGVRTLRFSSAGYISKVSDTPSKTLWRAAIKDPGDFSQFLFSAGTTSGSSSVGKGNVILANDGSLDYLRKIAFDGRSLEILKIANKSDAYTSAVVIFNGSSSGIDFTWNTIDIKMRDRLGELAAKQAQEALFAGTNSGSTGYEGTANDLKGYPKPFAYGGPIKQVSPPLLNSSTLIYGVNFDASGNRIAVNSFDAVYDSGLAITLDTAIGTSGDFATTALLQAASIGAGLYATCKAEGTFRLNSSPAGKVTCDFTVGASAAARTAAQIAKSLLVDRGGYNASDYDNASFTALDTSTSSVVTQIYVADTRNVLACVEEVLGSVGAGLIVNANGEFEVRRLVAPENETSLFTFNKNNIIVEASGGIQRVTSNDPGNGLPIKESIVEYDRVYTIQDEDALAGAVTDAVAQYLSQDYRKTDPVQNSEIATKHLLSVSRVFRTNLTNETDAETLRDYFNDLHKVDRDWLIIRTDADNLFEIGDTITVDIERYNLLGGKKLLILGRVFRLSRPFIDYYVWG